MILIKMVIPLTRWWPLFVQVHHTMSTNYCWWRYQPWKCR